MTHDHEGKIRPDDARYVDPDRPKRTAAELAAIREKEIADGWAKVAEDQAKEQDRVDRELARQAAVSTARRDGATS